LGLINQAIKQPFSFQDSMREVEDFKESLSDFIQQ